VTWGGASASKNDPTELAAGGLAVGLIEDRSEGYFFEQPQAVPRSARISNSYR
jgi:hypothetical protein